jgi:hypothetical protein
MRHGLTLAPACLVVFLALLGAGPDSPSDEVAILDQRFGLRTAPILLLTRPDVQLDLHLDAGQIAGARSTIARLLDVGLNSKTKSGPVVMTVRKAIDDEMRDWLTRHLAEGQLERLRQIDLQWEGVSAIIKRPVVAEYLRLTSQQRLTVNRVVTAERDLRRAHGILSPADHEEFSRQVLAVLSPGQRDLWDRLLGPPCRFAIGSQAGATSHRTPLEGLQSRSAVGR